VLAVTGFALTAGALMLAFQPGRVPLDRHADSVSTGQELDVALRQLLQEKQGSVGVILLDPATGVLAEHEANQPQVLASVAKLYTLCAYLDGVEQAGRDLTEAEVLALYAMIASSDNDVAWQLWNEIGGLEAVQRFLTRRGFPQISPGRDDSWGSLRASPRDVAGLLLELIAGRLLSPAKTDFALGLLANYNESQAWGISAGLQTDASVRVYLKNGWYPEPDGWVVNSAGIVDSDTAPAYILVALTNLQPSYEHGVETIEAVAELINSSVSALLDRP
jgi:beta-lactamase class A